MQQVTLGNQTFNLPYADLLPVLSDEEYAALRADIIARGIVVPVVIDEQGNVIDGQHRLRIAADLGLVDVPMDIRPGLVDSEREALALDLNLHRRHLSTEQRDKVIVWRRQKGESMRQIAEAVGVSRGTVANALSTVQNWTVELPSSVKGKDGKTRPAKQQPRVRTDSVAQASRALQLLGEAPDATDATDLSGLKRAVKEKRRQEEQARRTTLPADLPPAHDRYRLYIGDMGKVCRLIAPESVDAIITDPPYPEEYLPVYETLALEAVKVLKPGGSLLVMAGQSYLPDILRLMTPHIRYHWLVAYLTPGGQSAQLWQRKVNTFWKPVLWFINGDYDGAWIGDVSQSAVNDNNKRYHHWGQSESGMADLVDRFTYPGQTILDPFCGGGTTGVVAVQMSRRFIGIDIDETAIKTTQRRLLDIHAQVS